MMGNTGKGENFQGYQIAISTCLIIKNNKVITKCTKKHTQWRKITRA